MIIRRFLEFSNPWFLVLLVPVVLLVLYRIFSKKADRESYLEYSDISPIRDIKPGWKHKLRKFLNWVNIIAIFLFVIALAGPRAGAYYREIEMSGVDIMLTLDISSSMSSLDFEPKNRLEIAKQVVGRFISERENDRLGLVIFSSGAFTQCPLTLDHDLLLDLLKKVKIGLIEDGTAIGNALAVSVGRLKDSAARSKVIVLLTDGMNNRGEVQPLDAAKLAADNKIKVYTIGAGKMGTAMMPVEDPVYGKRLVEVEVKIDEDTLKKIASITGGEYFRAENTKSLENIYTRINKMEKTIMKPRYYVDYEPEYRLPMILGLILLVAAVFLDLFVVAKVP
jgi:Ca-activated chloride channel family protein